VFTVAVAALLILTGLARVGNRKTGSGICRLLFGGLLIWLGLWWFQGAGPYPKERQSLEAYSTKIADLVQDTGRGEGVKCMVKSTEVYDREYFGEKHIFGKTHLHIHDDSDVTIEIPVEALWDKDKKEWGSVAEQNLKLLALDRTLNKIDHTRQVLRGLGYE
jgi:hypothetical protein